MEKYIAQLHEDISCATANVGLPFIEKELELHDWISDEDEDIPASSRALEEWTGYQQSDASACNYAD